MQAAGRYRPVGPRQALVAFPVLGETWNGAVRARPNAVMESHPQSVALSTLVRSLRPL